MSCICSALALGMYLILPTGAFFVFALLIIFVGGIGSYGVIMMILILLAIVGIFVSKGKCELVER